MRGKKAQCRELKRYFLFSIIILIILIVIVFLAIPNHLNFKTKSLMVTPITKFQKLQYSPSEVKTYMQDRLNNLQTKCNKYGINVRGNDSLHKPNPREFLINKKYKLVWCNVFKAASTSWLYNLNLLAGYQPHFLNNTIVTPLKLARNRYPRPSEEELLEAVNISTTFLIVRHPFERLFNAYNDKIRFATSQSYQELGNQIVQKYRTNKLAKKIAFRETRPTFPEFVSFLIDEFSLYHKLDVHWMPITQLCTPCQVKFDIIAKFETLKWDQDFLIDRANLSSLISPQWKNPGKGEPTENSVLHFYSQLPIDQLQKLFIMYRYDFRLFGYTAEEYFEAVLLELITDP